MKQKNKLDHNKLFEELGLEDHLKNKNTQNLPINHSNSTLIAQNQLSRINQNQNQNNQNQTFSNINQQFASIQTPKNQNQKPIFVINIQIPINNQKISQQLKIYKETNLFQLSLEFCQTYNLNDQKNVQNLHSFLQEALTQSELQNKYNKSKSNCNSPSHNQSQNQNFSPQSFNLGCLEQNNNNIQTNQPKINKQNYNQIQINQPQINLQSNSIQTIQNQQNKYENHISKIDRQQSHEHKENKNQYEKQLNNIIDQEQQEKNQKFNVVLSNLNNIIQKRKTRNPSKTKKSQSKTQKQPKKDPIEIGQKLYETAKLKQQKHAQLIKQKQQEEEQKLFQTQKSQKNLQNNKISQKILQKQLRSKIENWPKEYLQKQEQKQKQLELQKQSQLQQELTECSFKPKINKNSENLVKNRQEILASQSTQNLTQKNETKQENNQIFQFLYQDAQNRKIRQQKEIEELVHMEQLKLQKLHINQAQADKNPDQIFNEFLERQKQKQQEQEQKTQNIAFALKNIDQKSGQPLFKPQIQTQKSFKNLNKTENFSQNQQQVQKQGQAVWDHLYENRKTLEQKNQQRINDQNQIIHSKSTSKLTDNYSNSIVTKQRTYLAQLIFYALCENSPKNSQLFYQSQLQNILNFDENFQNSHFQNDNHFISKDFITLKNLEKTQIKTLYPLLQQIEEKDLILNEKQFTQGFLIFYQQLTPLEKQTLQQIAQNSEIISKLPLNLQNSNNNTYLFSQTNQQNSIHNFSDPNLTFTPQINFNSKIIDQNSKFYDKFTKEIEQEVQENQEKILNQEIQQNQQNYQQNQEIQDNQQNLEIFNNFYSQSDSDHSQINLQLYQQIQKLQNNKSQNCNQQQYQDYFQTQPQNISNNLDNIQNTSNIQQGQHFLSWQENPINNKSRNELINNQQIY